MVIRADGYALRKAWSSALSLYAAPGTEWERQHQTTTVCGGAQCSTLFSAYIPGLRSWCRPPPSAQHNRCLPVPHAPRERYPTAVACGSYGGPWRGTRRPRPPRPGLSVNPSTRCSRKRCTHLYTKRRLIPTLTAMAVIATPSAKRRIIRARRRSPAWMAVDRCQARSVWRSSGVREMVREVVRPRAIQRPCVREVPPGTTWGPDMRRDDGRAGRPRRHRSPLYKGNVCPDGAPGSRATRFWSQTTDGASLTQEEGGFCYPDNHTISLCLCASAQHGFVGQVWSGRGVGIRPTRCPRVPQSAAPSLRREYKGAGWPTPQVQGVGSRPTA